MCQDSHTRAAPSPAGGWAAQALLLSFLSPTSWRGQPSPGRDRGCWKLGRLQSRVAGSIPTCQMASTKSSEPPRCLCPHPGWLSGTDPPRQPRCGGFFSAGSGVGGPPPDVGMGERMPHCWPCCWRGAAFAGGVPAAAGRRGGGPPFLIPFAGGGGAASKGSLGSNSK